MSWSNLGKPVERQAEGQRSLQRAWQWVRSTNTNFLWGVGEGSLRDNLDLGTWLNGPFPAPGFGILTAPYLHMHSLCLHRQVCVTEPCTPCLLPVEGRQNLWPTHPWEGGISLRHVLCDLSFKYPWVRHWLLTCSKSNKCQQCTMECPRNFGPHANTLPICWLIYHCMQGWDLILEWNSDRAGALMAESKSAGSHFTSREMKRLLFLAKNVFWTSGLWKQ